MSSSIKLKNANGKTVSVTNSNANQTDKEVIYLNTVDELANASGSINAVAIVSDLSRGGTFEWSPTGTANGGTVFAGVSGYWNRQYSGAVNVKWFGAKGDGVTDDTVAIQKSIDYCYSVRVIYDTATCYLSPGTYIIGNSLNIHSYITFIGDGHNSILKVKDNSDTFNVLNIIQDGANNINIKDFAIHGNYANNTNIINGIYVSPPTSPCIYSIFKNLYIKEMSGSSLYITNAGADRIKITDCLFRDSVKNNIYSTHLKYSSIDNCTIRTTKTGFNGILLDGTNNMEVIINNCTIEENSSFGIYLSQSYTISIRNTTVSYSGGTGIYVSRANDISISDSTIHDNQSYGILIEGNTSSRVYRPTINNCDIKGNNLHGLYIDYTNNALIQNNKFVDNSDAYPNVNSGIYAIRSVGNSIQMNTFSGTSQKYAIDFGANSSGNIFNGNNIVSVGSDYINSLLQNSTNYLQVNKIATDTALPTSGYWLQGDIVYNRLPVVNGFIGWVCTISGTPGTWKGFGSIQS